MLYKYNQVLLTQIFFMPEIETGDRYLPLFRLAVLYLAAFTYSVMISVYADYGTIAPQDFKQAKIHRHFQPIDKNTQLQVIAMY
jgi:hypothetical protein